MSNEILQTLEFIEKEKNIKREVLVEMLRAALTSACRKTFPNSIEYTVDVDPLTARFRVLKNGQEINDPHFGRIAAQTAKQVIIQKIREAERENVYQEFHAKLGDIVSGAVHRVEKRGLQVDLGNVDAFLPFRELIPGEEYRQGQNIRAVVSRVSNTAKGPEIILSRTDPNFVKCLFEMEVPELSEGIVQVKGVAREAGSRTKMAVFSYDDKVDCVGSCVGMRGQRVKNVVRELGNEKIDIVRWSSDDELYVRNALSPAELSQVSFNREHKRAEVLVEDDQLPLAIGKRGQNIRLASELTGWHIEIKSSSQRFSITDLEGVGKKTEEVLREHGIQTVKDIIKLTVEDLEQIPGLGRKTAERILASAQQLIISGQTSSSSKNQLSL